MPGTVAIYDPQFITRQGIEGLMDRLGLYEKVISTSSTEELDDILTTGQPQLLIVDHLPEPSFAHSSLKEIRMEHPGLKILVISDDNDKARIQAIINSGVKGFLTKSCSEGEVITAINTIGEGGKFFCKKVLEIIVSGEDYTYSELTEREIEIVKLIARGHSSAEVAHILVISVHTVNSHRKNILKKLGLKSPTELIIYAAERGWVGLD